tara:strand:+ start:243 stop:428 length:186 start_codon:yes stop_codon:yes gene_type:complete
MLIRAAARTSRLARLGAPVLRTRVAMINTDVPPVRTPERTAELERLAEEHNGFLFGEVVSG